MKNTNAPLLDVNELGFIAWFLEDAGTDFEDHTADETFLPASDETLAISAAIHAVYGDDAPEVEASILPGNKDAQVQFYTSQAMKFYAQRCQALAAGASIRFNPAEYAFLGELLELAGEDHEHLADDASFDLTLELNPENRTLFTRAVDVYLARHRKVRAVSDDAVTDTAAAIREALDTDGSSIEIDIPDYWLMFYLAGRCGGLARAR
ncbi:hypothetical protein [Massilia sp. S19_KUP03_FR1]|uniref:hypothetical protein n=1 Tax=Massilia sp. S19_KUP03_FR1 TaxID=3025503 RepID=UPI002FCDBDBA